MDKLYNGLPVDGLAGRVVSQTGCTDELTLDQQRRNLVSKVQRIGEEILKLPKGSAQRKQLGIEKFELQHQIKGMKTHRKGRDLTNYILEVLKSSMSKFEWDRAVDEAARLQKAEEN